MCGGGDSKTTVVNTNIPEFAEPYFTSLLDRAESVSSAGYVPYGGQRIAGVGEDAGTAYDMIRSTADQGIRYLDDAAGVSAYNIGAARNATQYDPYQFSATGVDPYSGFGEFGGFNEFGGFRESGDPRAYGDFDAYDFAPSGVFTPEAASFYMSPYMQNVVDVQQADARRQFDISQTGRDAAAVQAGAFGGSRGAVVDALAQEDLMRQLGEIQATGSQQAYEQATGAFEADRAARMGVEGMTADERARVQGMTAEELARVQGISVEEASRIQSAMSAEAARVQGLSAEEAARVQGMTAEELARVQGISVEEAARIQASQAQEDMAQKQLYLEGLGFASEEAARLAGYGEAERAADIQSAQLLEQVDKTLMAYEQAGLDMSYDDFLRQQGYPEQQLQLMSSILQGVPIAPTGTTETYTPYNPLQSALGAGISALGLYQGLTV